MNKSRCFYVLSDKKKTIYATHKTELQATRIVERLKALGIDDAYVFDNGGNQLTKRKYDKYEFANNLLN